MAIKIAGRLFTGPFSIDSMQIRSNRAPVVYVIVRKGGDAWDPIFRLIDVGESAGADFALADHPSRASWGESRDEVGVYLFEMNGEHKGTDEERRAIAAGICEQYATPNDEISVR
jgi:hypothetical protein